MKFKLNNYLYFNNLIKKLNSNASKEEITGVVNKNIASSSRRFIRAGKVTPPIKPSTIENRVKGGTKPLFDTGNLADSIRATKKGVAYADYGKYHRRGTPSYNIKSKIPMSFIMGGEKVVTKNVSHPGLEKREFISWYADKDEKRKIINNVKRQLSKLIKDNLRKKL